MSEILMTSTLLITSVLGVKLAKTMGMVLNESMRVNSLSRLNSSVNSGEFYEEHLRNLKLKSKRGIDELKSKMKPLNSMIEMDQKDCAGGKDYSKKKELNCTIAVINQMKTFITNNDLLNMLVMNKHRDEYNRILSLSNTVNAYAVGKNISKAVEAAKETRQRLDTFIRTMIDEISQAEREIVISEIDSILRTDNYEVMESKIDDGSLIVAKKDLNIVAIFYNNGGKLTVDTAGFKGNECHLYIRSILRRLEERGVGIRVMVREKHQRKDSGVLIDNTGSSLEELSCVASRLVKRLAFGRRKLIQGRSDDELRRIAYVKRITRRQLQI